MRAGGIALFIYGGLIALTYLGFAHTPTGFIPPQDKQYLVSFAQLPDAATLDRTEAVIRRMGEIALKQPGVDHAVSFPGLSINGFTNSPNSGIVFVTLKPFEERKSKRLSAGAIAAALNQQYGGIQDAFIAVFPPPPVMGLGTIGGFRMQIEDRGGLGFEELYKQTQNLLAKGSQNPALQGLFSGYQVNVPQIDAEVDREKAKSQGVSVQELFDTMQVYLGSLYVNDFNAFGRTYPGNRPGRAEFPPASRGCRQAQDSQCRRRHDPVGLLRHASSNPRVPIASCTTTATRPPRSTAGPAPGFSTGQAQAAMEQLARQELPNGMSFEWTELTYQQILAGNTAVLRLPAGGAAGVPGAGRPVRELEPAARGHPDHADGAVLGHHRRCN